MKDTHWTGALALAVLSLIVAGIALAATTTTSAGWQLVNANGTTPQPSYAACVSALKAQPPPARQRTDYCREKWVTKVTADPPPPPPPAPVDCVVSDWTTSTGEWSACANSVQTRTTTRTRTVVTPASNGGKACPALTDSTVESRSCSTETPPPAGDVVYASPPTADTSNLKPGQTLVLTAGTYTSLKLKACAADAWCTVRAETDGAAILTSLNIGPGNWYTAIEGLKVTGASSKVVTGSYVAFRRVAFSGGPATGNDVSVQLGTNDRTPGCSNITVEDSWVYGLGGRYKLLVYNCDTVKLTRIVVRHDGGWKYDGRNPQGGITVYDSRNVALENVACVDSAQGLDGFESCIYLVSNGTTSTKQANVTVNGAIIIDSPNNGLGAEGNGSAATYTVNDLLVVNSSQGGINTNNSAHVVNATRVTCSVKGVCFGKWAQGGAIKVNGCKVGKGTLSSGASLTNCPGGAGADFGNLFPWPNEARMKADFDAVRPAFGGRSFTGYVQGATP